MEEEAGKSRKETTTSGERKTKKKGDIQEEKRNYQKANKLAKFLDTIRNCNTTEEKLVILHQILNLPNKAFTAELVNKNYKDALDDVHYIAYQETTMCMASIQELRIKLIATNELINIDYKDCSFPTLEDSIYYVINYIQESTNSIGCEEIVLNTLRSFLSIYMSYSCSKLLCSNSNSFKSLIDALNETYNCLSNLRVLVIYDNNDSFSDGKYKVVVNKYIDQLKLDLRI